MNIIINLSGNTKIRERKKVQRDYNEEICSNKDISNLLSVIAVNLTYIGSVHHVSGPIVDPGDDGSWFDTFDASDTTDPWKHYHPSKPSKTIDLDDIDHKDGSWINVTRSGGTVLFYNGVRPTLNQTITLQFGWNLVGYPSLNDNTRDAAFNNLTFDTHVDAIWTYNSTQQQWIELGKWDYFELGRGYWVHAIEECEWDVPL